MKKYAADKSCLGILLFLIFIMLLTMSGLVFYYLSFIPIIMWSLVGIFFILWFFIAVIYLPAYFRNTSFYVSENRIVKQSGVFYSTKQVMDLESIQYFTMLYTIFGRKTGFNFLLLNSFGGRMFLPFLRRDDIDELASYMETSGGKEISNGKGI